LKESFLPLPSINPLLEVFLVDFFIFSAFDIKFKLRISIQPNFGNWQPYIFLFRIYLTLITMIKQALDK